jgi:thiol:disulfide interchange protein DsbD
MKNIKICLLVLLTSLCRIATAQIQPDPAHWAYGLKKLEASNYEVHLKCTIDEGWHIYAQKQTGEFIGTRTKIAFAKATGLVLTGLPVEVGKKEKYVVKEVGITNYEYAGTVDFVQKATIKPGIKELKGTITYQTCTHDHCLTEKTISFTIPVN